MYFTTTSESVFFIKKIIIDGERRREWRNKTDMKVGYIYIYDWTLVTLEPFVRKIWRQRMESISIQLPFSEVVMLVTRGIKSILYFEVVSVDLIKISSVNGSTNKILTLRPGPSPMESPSNSFIFS